MFLILTQLSFLLLTASGWGWWLHRFLFRKVTLSARGLLLCFGAGFCLQLVPLTNLMYLDFSIRQTFWIPAAVGVAGLAHCWLHRQEVPRFCPRDIRELKWAAGIFAAVFVLQGVSLFHDGPFDYYGAAFQDHVSYVSLAQWMVDRPYSILSAGTEPWLLKAITLKWHRPGQSVAQAYLAAGTFGDAKEVFGTLSTFFIAIFGVMTYLVARSLSMSRPASATAALWAALSPGATKVHLFGFLSQASTLFALPALVLSVRMPGRELWRRMTLPGIFLSYVFICYTEFFPFAVIILVALLLTLPPQPFRARALVAAGALFIGVLLVPPYLPHVGTFMFRQLEIAAAPNVNLDGFSPFAGSVYGWAADLLAVPALASPADFRIMTILGYLLLIAVASAYFSISMRRRMWLAALVAAPMLGLFAMGSSAEFSRYGF